MSTQDRKVQRIITFQLDQGETCSMALNASELEADIQKDEVEFKDIKKHWSGKIKEKKSQLSDMLKAIGKGEIEREVECIERMDWSEKTVYYLDLNDPPNVIEERPMTEEETQMSFGSDDTPKTAKRGKKHLKAVEFEAPAISDEAQEVRDVMRSETSRKTKKSSVDPVEPMPF